MGVKTIKVIECDECSQRIVADTPAATYIDAGVYGKAFHPSCWVEIGGPRVARVLYLDDIAIREIETNVKIDRAWGPRDAG